MTEPASWIEVSRSIARSRAEEHTLVLQATGIGSALLETEGRHAVVVPAAHAGRARAEIEKYERENPDSPTLFDSPPPIAWGIRAALVYGAVLALFHGRDALSAGRADAGLIREGAWWLCLTALCLHADLAHLAGNLLFGALFGVMLAQSVGFGVAWLGFVLTGAVGNGLNAWLQAPSHTSIGASTGVFGMLGMQVAVDWMRRRRFRHGRFRRWAPLVMGAALLAWLGGGRPGERIDVWAHLFGFAAGVGLGVLLGMRAPMVPRTTWVQGVFAGAAVGALTIAWVLAR